MCGGAIYPTWVSARFLHFFCQCIYLLFFISHWITELFTDSTLRLIKKMIGWLLHWRGVIPFPAWKQLYDKARPCIKGSTWTVWRDTQHVASQWSKVLDYTASMLNVIKKMICWWAKHMHAQNKLVPPVFRNLALNNNANRIPDTQIWWIASQKHSCCSKQQFLEVLWKF